MTQLRTDKKAHALRGTAAFIVAVFSAAVLLFTGCPNSHSNKPATPKYKLTFSVDGGGGSLTAKIGETEIKSDSEIEQNKTVIFTATPNTNYVVDKWTIQGGSFEAGTGTNGNTTAKVKVTANTTVKVSFKKMYSVTFNVEGGNGTLKATPEGGAETAASPISVEHEKTVTFTATAETDYKVEKWTITGGTFVEGGSEGSPTAKVKVTAAATVTVSFTRYVKVPFGTNGEKLAHHLQTATPASDGIYYIEVTGLTKQDLQGDGQTHTPTPSPLGLILKAAPTKKVALKLGSGITGLTDMSCCFAYCENLVSVAAIPKGVTNMGRCFENCTSLKQAPVIQEGVTNMRDCFVSCTNLVSVAAIPKGVTNMEGCFNGCKSLEKAPTIPNSVTDMKHCFNGCTNLKQVPSISNTVTNMHECFSNCTNLTTVPSIPAAVTNMQGCFANCTKLTSVTLECDYNPATHQGNPVFGNAFVGCTELKAGSIKVPQGQLSAYQAAADDMGTTADRFVE